MQLSVINNPLPPEMVEKILKLLSYKEIYQAQLICKRWKQIIKNGNLLQKSSGKFPLIHMQINVLYEVS